MLNFFLHMLWFLKFFIFIWIVMHIRKAEIRDLDSDLFLFYQENLQFHAQARPDYFYLWDVEDNRQTLKEFIETWSFLLLEDDFWKILWFVYYIFKDEGKKIIWIKELFIAKTERKKWYGKYLINEIKKIWRENGCVGIEFCCWWFNKNALEMYQHIWMNVQKFILESNLVPF